MQIRQAEASITFAGNGLTFCASLVAAMAWLAFAMAGNRAELFSSAKAAPKRVVAPARKRSQTLPLLTLCFGSERAKLVASCGATVCTAN